MRLRLAAGSVLAAAAIAACVIAEPPSDLPSLPARPPFIEQGSVVPPSTAVLARWPDKFFVPVQLTDPHEHIEYSTFIDYNPATGEGFQQFIPSEFDLATTQGSTRVLEFSISEPSPDSCHVVEMVVALRLNANSDGKNAHTPQEPGGDSVRWFYNPSGDLGGCPFLDAGLLPDAQALEAIADGGFP